MKRHNCLWILVSVLTTMTIGNPVRPTTLYAAASFSGDVTGTVEPTGFGDLINNPNDFWSWDNTAAAPITYRFENTGPNRFTNDARIRDQIRLAFQEWDLADMTPPGATDSYGRANGFQPFGDIRTIMVHEIGHILGFGHPNQANSTTPRRNYDLDVTPPVLKTPTTDEVMHSSINSGSYNHILSHDELEGFDYFYGRDLAFQESTTGAADIVIRTDALPNTGSMWTWAQGPPTGTLRNTTNPLLGRRIISGEVTFSTAAGQPMGFRTLGINWDYQNTSGQPTESFEIRTRGTNNPSPVSRYDGRGNHEFFTFNNSDWRTAPGLSANFKDDLLHVWSNPIGGQLPATQIIHVGLEQDVWDWTVVSAEVVSPTGARTATPLLSFHDWNNAVTGVLARPGGQEGDQLGITNTGPVTVLAQGIRVVASDVFSEVSNFQVAEVGDLGLTLDELNRDTLEELRNQQRLESLGIDPILLDNRQEYFLIFDGTEADLPEEIRNAGNFVILDRPDLLGTELFVFAQSMSEESVVGTYALLGTPPIVPEPSAISLVCLGVGVICILRRRPRTSKGIV